MRNRNETIDPDCPHGGPTLTDAGMEWAYNLIEKMEVLGWDRLTDHDIRPVTITLDLRRPGKSTADFTLESLGVLRATISRMQSYIKECEAELEKAGLLPK